MEKVRKRTLARAAELAAPRLSEKGLPRSAKWLIPIAVIISLIAAAGSVSADLKRYEPGTWNERIPSFEAEKREKTGVEVTLEDGTTVIKSLPYDPDDMPETLDELYDFLDCPDIVLPYGLTEGTVRIDLCVDCVQFKKADLTILLDNDQVSMRILTNQTWNIATKGERIGAFEVSLFELDGIHRGDIMYKNTYYVIEAKNEDSLYKIINSLEERKID